MRIEGEHEEQWHGAFIIAAIPQGGWIMDSESSTTESSRGTERRYELLCGVLLAIFASLLAVIDMGGGKAGNDELLANSDSAEAYAWYSSKSIKQSLAEGQRDILESLLNAGALATDQSAGSGEAVTRLTAKIERYASEKDEILRGSSTVGEEHWAQDVDGELGRITGAQEYEALAAQLAGIGDVFDSASLYLQLCLVLGAVSLLFGSAAPRWVLFTAMLVSGLIGTGYGISAWLSYLAIG